MTAPILLAIDVGTQSVRALAFQPDGTLLDKAQLVYAPAYHEPHPGWAERDPNAYWDALGQVCTMLWDQGQVTPSQISAVALTVQRGTMVFVDHAHEPLRPAILWLDQRRAERYPRPPVWLALATRAAGLRRSLDAILAGAPANWVRAHEPEVWAQTRHVLLLSGFLTLRLVGEVRDATACQVGHVPLDARNQQWAGPSHWQWRGFGIRRDQVPELVPPGTPLGTLTAQAAQHTGLPEGLPLISAGSDKACEVLGSGCLSLDEACVGLGTTATINIVSPRFVEPLPFQPPLPSAHPGKFGLEYMVYRGFWMVTWFKEQFAHAEAELAAARGISVEQVLEEQAAAVPAGAMGLTLQPFWSPGTLYPSYEAKGAIIGFGGSHQKAHLYRALLEGVGYGLRDGLDRMLRRTGQPLKRISVVGGGSQSDLAVQIMADILGVPAVRPSLYEASGLGAAILAAVGMGVHPNLNTAVQAMAHPGDRFEPIPDHVMLYDQLYREVYSRMYSRLQPLYIRIMERVGYPPS